MIKKIINKKTLFILLIMISILFSNLKVNSEDTNINVTNPPQQENITDRTVFALEDNITDSIINNDNSDVNPDNQDDNSSLSGNANSSLGENNNNNSIVTDVNNESVDNNSLSDYTNTSHVENNNSIVSELNNEPDNSSKNDSHSETEIYTPLGEDDSSDSSNLFDTNPNNTYDNSSNDSILESIQKINLYDGGKLQFKGIPEDYKDKIKKFESVKSLSEKEVIINSTQDLNQSIIVYTDIPEISKNQKSSLQIYWVTGNQNIDLEDIEFYDSNNDSLYDRISWTVPHLSEQVFEIRINYSVDKNDSNTILSLGLIGPSVNSIVENPINFRFNLSYYDLSKLTCSLGIDGYSDIRTINASVENLTLVWNNPLANGNHNWIFSCFDITNNTINSTLSGSFLVNESFGLVIPYITYFPGENVSLIINSKGNETRIELIYPNSSRISLPSIINQNNPQNYLISSDSLQIPGNYILNITTDYFEKPYSFTGNFSVSKIQLNSNKDHINENQTITLNEYANSPIEKISWYLLDFGDNYQDYSLNYENNILDKSLQHTYNHAGNYSLNLTLRIGSRSYTTSKIIFVNQSLDRIPPTISLYFPENGDIIKNDSINFSFSAFDNIRLSNCTFEIYNTTGDLGVLIYSKTNLNQNNSIQNISISGLDEGYYTWMIECYDNSSNYQYDSRDFKIDFPSNITPSSTNTTQQTSSGLNNNLNYTGATEIKNLISDLNTFLTKQQSYNPDQKEAMDDLGISNNLDYYNKRLAQIDQDLNNNVNYIKDIPTKNARIADLLKEVENISLNIPSNVEIIDKSEFVKNSISGNLENILDIYTKSKKMTLNKGELKDLTNNIFSIQKDFSISTKVKQVRITYNNTKEEFTLVSKTLTIQNDSNDSTEKILEIIPIEVSINPKSIVFMNNNQNINDSIFEFSENDLSNGKLIYTVEGFIDPKMFEKTDTLLYKEFPIKNSGITGFFVLDLNNSIKNSLYYSIIICIIFGLFIFFIASKKIKMMKWRKDEKVIKIYSLMKEAKKEINKKDYISAKERYNEIKNIYPEINKGCKRCIYKKIEEIRVDLDKKDISNMIKEYNEAKSQNRNDDAKLIYENIKINYKKLPKKYQKKVYEKIFKNSSEK